MRLTAQIVAVTAAATVIGGGIAVWAAAGTGSSARPASEHAAMVVRRPRPPAPGRARRLARQSR